MSAMPESKDGTKVGRSIIPTCSAKRGRRRHCAQCRRRPRLAEQVGIILRPTFVPSSLHGIVPRLIILLYNPNGGSGVPPIFYRGPRGPSPAVAGSPPARRRVPAACGGVPPIICRGPRGPLPTIGGVPAGSPLHVVGFPPSGSPLGLSGEHSSQSDQTGKYLS